MNLSSNESNIGDKFTRYWGGQYESPLYQSFPKLGRLMELSAKAEAEFAKGSQTMRGIKPWASAWLHPDETREYHNLNDDLYFHVQSLRGDVQERVKMKRALRSWGITDIPDGTFAELQEFYAKHQEAINQGVGQ